MNCLWVQKKLSSLLDGELPENIRRQIENHLAVCDRCRREWDYLKLQNQILQRTLPLAVSADWSEKFFRNLSRQKEKMAFPVEIPGWRFIPYPLAVAALAMIFLGWSIFTPLVYGASHPEINRHIQYLLKNNLAPVTQQSIFAPVNLFHFCRQYCQILCRHCDNCPENYCGR